MLFLIDEYRITFVLYVCSETIILNFICWEALQLQFLILFIVFLNYDTLAKFVLHRACLKLNHFECIEFSGTRLANALVGISMEVSILERESAHIIHC